MCTCLYPMVYVRTCVYQHTHISTCINACAHAYICGNIQEYIYIYIYVERERAAPMGISIITLTHRDTVQSDTYREPTSAALQSAGRCML